MKHPMDHPWAPRARELRGHRRALDVGLRLLGARGRRELRPPSHDEPRTPPTASSEGRARAGRTEEGMSPRSPQPRRSAAGTWLAGGRSCSGRINTAPHPRRLGHRHRHLQPKRGPRGGQRRADGGLHVGHGPRLPVHPRPLRTHRHHRDGRAAPLGRARATASCPSRCPPASWRARVAWRHPGHRPRAQPSRVDNIGWSASPTRPMQPASATRSRTASPTGPPPSATTSSSTTVLPPSSALADEVERSDTAWDLTLWGDIPEYKRSAIRSSQYGQTLEGVIAVFEDPSYCNGGGGQ